MCDAAGEAAESLEALGARQLSSQRPLLVLGREQDGQVYEGGEDLGALSDVVVCLVDAGGEVLSVRTRAEEGA